jgi:hypothetical protein
MSGAERCVALRLDFDGSANGHKTPDLFDLGVADSDAPVGPVNLVLE